jgi:hypothetical protein
VLDLYERVISKHVPSMDTDPMPWDRFLAGIVIEWNLFVDSNAPPITSTSNRLRNWASSQAVEPPPSTISHFGSRFIVNASSITRAIAGLCYLRKLPTIRHSADCFQKKMEFHLATNLTWVILFKMQIEWARSEPLVVAVAMCPPERRCDLQIGQVAARARRYATRGVCTDPGAPGRVRCCPIPNPITPTRNQANETRSLPR